MTPGSGSPIGRIVKVSRGVSHSWGGAGQTRPALSEQAIQIVALIESHHSMLEYEVHGICTFGKSET